MESSPPCKGRSKPSARNKMMDLLARRDHSEKELRKKLLEHFSPEEVDQAIEFGKESNWIPHGEIAEKALAEKTAAILRRRGKGILYINQYLHEKGLPKVSSDPSEELDKALALVENKFSNFEDLDRDEKAKVKAKMGRFLMSRGFDMDIVRKVVYDKN